MVSESDANISDITFLISHAALLSAFSYRSQQTGLTDEQFESFFPVLSNAEIRLVDLNGSCPTKEIELIIKHLNVKLIRFHRYPGINVDTFEKIKVMNSVVEFVVAQGVHPGVVNGGIKFLRHLKNVFPAMKNIFWDWNEMMPALIQVDAEVIDCLNELSELYKDLEMNLLAILFFMSNEGSEEIMDQIWKHLQTFNLPNARMIRVERNDKPHHCPPYMLFIAGITIVSLCQLAKDNFGNMKFQIIGDYLSLID
uniref:F-box domain-containing protein n=1 Tax=Elaeophora elaphi TaxID=1147741 RepID=A0A0R3S7E5_9BILA